jgi:hypothetical protein
VTARISPLARALCELTLVEAYDPAAGRVVAVPLSWAMDQVAPPPLAVVVEAMPEDDRSAFGTVTRIANNMAREGV